MKLSSATSGLSLPKLRGLGEETAPIPEKNSQDEVALSMRNEIQYIFFRFKSVISLSIVKPKLRIRQGSRFDLRIMRLYAQNRQSFLATDRIVRIRRVTSICLHVPTPFKVKLLALVQACEPDPARRPRPSPAPGHALGASRPRARDAARTSLPSRRRCRAPSHNGSRVPLGPGRAIRPARSIRTAAYSIIFENEDTTDELVHPGAPFFLTLYFWCVRAREQFQTEEEKAQLCEGTCALARSE